MKLFKTSDMHIVKYTVNSVFPLTCRVICGKSEPERLKVNSVNFVSVYTLVVSICLSVCVFQSINQSFICSEQHKKQVNAQYNVEQDTKA